MRISLIFSFFSTKIGIYVLYIISSFVYLVKFNIIFTFFITPVLLLSYQFFLKTVNIHEHCQFHFQINFHFVTGPTTLLKRKHPTQFNPLLCVQLTHPNPFTSTPLRVQPTQWSQHTLVTKLKNRFTTQLSNKLTTHNINRVTTSLSSTFTTHTTTFNTHTNLKLSYIT